MKKIFIIAIAACAMYSCGKKQQEAKADIDEFSSIAQNVDKAHNAQNSLDYEGAYIGTIPSASGEGIDVTITLSDSTYTKKISYIGKKDSSSETNGTYSWNKDGSTITLKGETAPNQYFVGENTLTQLDIDGNKITGAMADNYVLSKK